MSSIKGNKFILFTICLSAIVILSFIYLCCSSSANVVPLDIDFKNRLEFFNDGSGGIVVLESTDNGLIITKSKKPKEKLKLNCTYDFSKQVGKKIYLFSAIVDDKTSILSYSITKHEVSSPVEYVVKIDSEENIAILKNSKAFAVSSFRRTNIFSFFIGKSKISGHAVKEEVKRLKNNLSGDLIYSQTNSDTNNIIVYDKTFSIKNALRLSLTIEDDFEFLSDDIILDSSGNVFTRDVDSENEFEKLKHIDIDKDNSMKCICKNYIATLSSKRTIKLFDLSSDDKDLEYECEEDVVYLTSHKEKLLVVEQKDSSFCLKEIQMDDVMEPRLESFVPRQVVVDIENETDQENVLKDTHEKENVLEATYETVQSDNDIESSVYSIDLERKIIKDVELETSVAKFKKNIYVNGGKVKVIKNKKTVVSGKVGTGTKLQFLDKNGELQEFSLIVKGDVTGSGSVSSLDIRAIYNHIFKNKILDGVQLEAADINDDGNVDTLDLLAVSKMQR